MLTCAMLTCALSLSAHAQQPSKEDIDKLLKNTQRMVDSLTRIQKDKLSGMNPGNNGISSMPRNAPPPRNAAALGISRPDDKLKYAPPPRNAGALGALPNKKLSVTELRSYITDIDKKLTALLQSEGVQLPNVEALDAGTLCQSSIMGLLQGGGEVIAWEAIKAIEKAPGNILVLENCGAILNGCGFQPIAIPVLETALERSPGNSTVQNNLGQSYVALGETQKATLLLQQCIKSSPGHPHANYSLACIYHSKGDDGSALTYVENSLRGSFSEGAWRLLLKLKKDARLMDYIKARYEPPLYFDEDKYHLPLQCERVADIPAKRAEYKVYHEMLESTRKQMKQMADDEFVAARTSIPDEIKNYKQSGIANPPFAGLGSAMQLDLSNKYAYEDGPEIGRLNNKYSETIKALSDEYIKKRNKSESCAAEVGLSNDYMEIMADLTRDYQKAYLRIYKEYYNNWQFWGSFAAVDEHTKRATFCRYAADLLSTLSGLAQTHFLNSCQPEPEVKKDSQLVIVPRPDCPIDIDYDCVIGSFHLDCTKIKFSTKAGLVLNMDHSFANHRTTIMIGPGEDLKFKLSYGNIEGQFKIAGKMQYFISFDGTRPSDQGLIWKSGISYKQEITNDYGFKNIETTNMDYTAGNTLSVANGWTFDGTLYQHLDKLMGTQPEKQENKNVKIYK